MSAKTISSHRREGAAGQADLLGERRHALDRYAALLHRLAGANLLSLVVHGPALDPEAASASAHVDNVMVLGQDDLMVLRALSRLGSQLDQDGIAAPLVMTPATIASSLDTFPLELLDIAQRHVLVRGQDPFVGLSLDRGHVRLQCERELKTIGIAMRQRILRVGGDERALALGDLVEATVRVARGMLLLAGAAPERTSAGVLSALGRLRGRESTAIRASAGSRGWDAYVAFYRELLELERSVESAAPGSATALPIRAVDGTAPG